MCNIIGLRRGQNNLFLFFLKKRYYLLVHSGHIFRPLLCGDDTLALVSMIDSGQEPQYFESSLIPHRGGLGAGTDQQFWGCICGRDREKRTEKEKNLCPLLANRSWRNSGWEEEPPLFPEGFLDVFGSASAGDAPHQEALDSPPTPLSVEAMQSAVFSQTTALREKLQTPHVFQQKHHIVVQARADWRVWFFFFMLTMCWLVR